MPNIVPGLLQVCQLAERMGRMAPWEGRLTGRGDCVHQFGRTPAATTNYYQLARRGVDAEWSLRPVDSRRKPGPRRGRRDCGFLPEHLGRGTGVGRHVAACALDGSRVRAILEPLYSRVRGEGQRFYKADLEAAVNDAYIRSVSAAIPADGWVHGSFEDVVRTKEILAESLAVGPRPMQPDSVERFVNDIHRYCSRDAAASIRARLSPEAGVHRNGGPMDQSLFRRIRKRLPRPVAQRRR